MEPPRGLWASLWNFLCFLPFFIGLLILGFIKGIILLPVILVIVSIGISGIIVILWPIHCFYTYYCILSTRQFGPAPNLHMFSCCLDFIMKPKDIEESKRLWVACLQTLLHSARADSIGILLS